MPKTRNPRRGSLQYWPRVRARREYARIRSWKTPSGAQGLLAFPGYKAGMVRVIYRDPDKASPTHNEMLAVPCTVLECPPLKIFSVRFYAYAYQGLCVTKEIRVPKMEKQLSRKIVVQKKAAEALPATAPERCVDIRVVVYTQPHKTGIGKKRPELFEVALGGSLEEKLAFIREHLDKEISITTVMKPGLFVDIKGVTTGKGFQGQLKRFGTKRKRHKSEKGVRRNIVGSEGFKHVLHTAPMPGKMGYHARTQYNNWLLKIVEKPEFAPFTNYGVVRNPCVIVKGSLPGPQKRLLTLTRPIRAAVAEKMVPQLKVIL